MVLPPAAALAYSSQERPELNWLPLSLSGAGLAQSGPAEGTSIMSLGTILLIILIIALLGGFSGRFGGYGYGFGHGGVGILGTVLIVVLILVLLGRL
jgi:hypothetical protein